MAIKKAVTGTVAGLLTILLVLGLSGCDRQPAATLLQGVFTKNGIVLTGNEMQPQKINMKVNGQEKPVNWHYEGGRTVAIPEDWQRGANYELNVDGQTWSASAPEKPGTFVRAVVGLGSLEDIASIQEWAPQVYEETAVSADGQYVAVASFDHTVYMYDKAGKKLWDYRIPSGLPVSVAFAADGATVFVGESSTDARLYAFDTVSGKLLWQYSFSEQIGSGANAQWSNRPKVRSLAVSGNKVIAAGEYRQRVIEKKVSAQPLCIRQSVW